MSELLELTLQGFHSDLIFWEAVLDLIFHEFPQKFCLLSVHGCLLRSVEINDACGRVRVRVHDKAPSMVVDVQQLAVQQSPPEVVPLLLTRRGIDMLHSHHMR